MGLDPEKRLVVYPDGHAVVLLKQEAAKFVADYISDGGDREDIKIYKQSWIEVEKKVKVSVEVEV